MIDPTKPRPATTELDPNDVDAILTQRGNRYGKFREHAEITQRLKLISAHFVERVHGKPIQDHLSASQLEALDMVFHKVGRILNGDPNYADSWIDIAGYAKLEADILEGVVR